MTTFSCKRTLYSIPFHSIHTSFGWNVEEWDDDDSEWWMRDMETWRDEMVDEETNDGKGRGLLCSAARMVFNIDDKTFTLFVVGTYSPASPTVGGCLSRLIYLSHNGLISFSPSINNIIGNWCEWLRPNAFAIPIHRYPPKNTNHPSSQAQHTRDVATRSSS